MAARTMEPSILTPIDSLLAELSITERGFVLGALLLGQEQAATSAAVSGDAAERCREVLAAAAALPRQERLRCMDILAREAIAPLPPGLAAVQEDVLVTALEKEPALIIRAIAAQGPAVLKQAAAAVLRAKAAAGEARPDDAEGDGDAATVGFPPAEVIADLQRAVLVTVMGVSPRAGGDPPKRLARRLATLAPDELLAEVMAIGADVLGTSLRGAEDSTMKRALIHAGPAWSDRIAKAARATVVDGDPAAPRVETANARALTASVTPGADARDTLARLGARALGQRLNGEEIDLTLSVAQRLPPAPRRELLAGAQCPPFDTHEPYSP